MCCGTAMNGDAVQEKNKCTLVVAISQEGEVLTTITITSARSAGGGPGPQVGLASSRGRGAGQKCWAHLQAARRRECWWLAGHPLLANAGLIWFLRCGLYTDRSLQGLRFPCKGKPSNPTWATRLRQGRRPISGQWLGDPVHASGETWWATTARPRDRADCQGLCFCKVSLQQEEA